MLGPAAGAAFIAGSSGEHIEDVTRQQNGRMWWMVNQSAMEAEHIIDLGDKASGGCNVQRTGPKAGVGGGRGGGCGG